MISLNTYIEEYEVTTVNESIISNVRAALSLVSRTCKDKNVSHDLIKKVLKVPTSRYADILYIVLLVVKYVRQQLKEHPEMVQNIKDCYRNGELDKYLKTQLKSDMYKLAKDVINKWVVLFGVLSMHQFDWFGIFS